MWADTAHCSEANLRLLDRGLVPAFQRRKPMPHIIRRGNAAVARVREGDQKMARNWPYGKSSLMPVVAEKADFCGCPRRVSLAP